MAEGTRTETGRHKRRRRLKNARRFVTAAAARAALAILSRVPFSVTRRCFPILTRAFAFLVRRKACENLGHAFGDAMPLAERRRVANRLAFNLGLILAESLALSRDKIPPGYFELGDVQPRLDDLIAQGKGVIGLTGHTGNWELMAATVAQASGSQMGSMIAKRHPNPYLNPFIESLRTRHGGKVTYQDEGLRPLVRELRSGKVLGMVPDQDMRKFAGIFVPFFGRPAYTPIGPASLSYLTGAPIFAGFTRRTDKGLVLDLVDPIWPDTDADRKTEIERLTLAWQAAIEDHVRKQPSDWMWFHERWKSTPESLEARREARRATQEE